MHIDRRKHLYIAFIILHYNYSLFNEMIFNLPPTIAPAFEPPVIQNIYKNQLPTKLEV